MGLLTVIAQIAEMNTDIIKDRELPIVMIAGGREVLGITTIRS